MNFTSPLVIYIIKTIKQIQTRMKEPDMAKLEYLPLYNALSQEFYDFANIHSKIFTNVVRGENLELIATILYYKDKVFKGEMTEAQVSEMLATRYLPPDLKTAADNKINILKKQGKI